MSVTTRLYIQWLTTCVLSTDVETDMSYSKTARRRHIFFTGRLAGAFSVLLTCLVSTQSTRDVTRSVLSFIRSRSRGRLPRHFRSSVDVAGSMADGRTSGDGRPYWMGTVMPGWRNKEKAMDLGVFVLRRRSAPSLSPTNEKKQKSRDVATVSEEMCQWIGFWIPAREWHTFRTVLPSIAVAYEYIIQIVTGAEVITRNCLLEVINIPGGQTERSGVL